jgi:hypothetical protein
LFDTSPVRQWFGIAGLVGGVGWTLLAFFPPEDEVVRNRLWTPALLGMLLGVIGLFLSLRPTLTRAGEVALKAVVLGLGLMTLGNLVEYWTLAGQPHQGGFGGVARGVAWMTFLLGGLLVALGSVVVGASALRTQGSPAWLDLLFVLFVPLTVAFAFVNPGLAAVPLACLASAGLLPIEGQSNPSASSPR